MAFSSSYNAFKKWSTHAIAAILEQPHRAAPSLASYTKFRLPVKYEYKRPDFLDLDVEATLASADHEIRPVMRPKKCLALDAGYAETINAGKTNKINEDQSVVVTFLIHVPEEYREEGEDPAKYSIPCAYFAIFDGHAGTGAGLMSSRHLHTHLKSRLTDVSHMLILTKEELARNYLNHGLIQDVTAEKLIAGALEETFVEFDDRIKNEKLDYFIDGGCTALVALFMMGKLFVANAGDCRAVVYKDFDPVQMSFDHSPENERQRIQNLAYQRPALLADEFTRLQFQHRPRRKNIGTRQLYRDRHMSGWGLKTIDRNDIKPQLISGEGKRARLMDTIGVTRGLGDHDIEFLYAPGLKIKPFMLPNPEVRIYDLANKTFAENDVLVMGSDGLWERFENPEVIEVLKEKFEQQSKAEPRRYIVAAQALVDEARGTLGERGWRTRKGDVASYDDISVFVVPLATHTQLQNYIVTKNEHEEHGVFRTDSFEQRYGKREEVEIQLGNRKPDDKKPEDLKPEEIKPGPDSDVKEVAVSQRNDGSAKSETEESVSKKEIGTSENKSDVDLNVISSGKEAE